MFSHMDVRGLLTDARLRPPVASFYVNADRTHPEGEKILASFRHLVHEADKILRRRPDARSAIAGERLKEALPEMLRFLDTDATPEQVIRGIAMFVSLAESPDHSSRTPPFTAFTLPRPVRNQAAVDRRPYVRPLLFLLDQYERVGLLVTDRSHARTFTLFLGEIEHGERRTADTPRHHHKGGWKQMLFQRGIEGRAKAHIRSTVRSAVNLFGRFPLQRIVLGGTDETIALVKRELPARFQSAVIGTFAADAHMSDAVIVSKALAIAHEAEIQKERERVQELSEALTHSLSPSFAATEPTEGSWSRPREHAVHGVRETLQALSQQRVQRLLLRRGLHLPGSVCENCESLFTTAHGPCAYCRRPLRPVLDILEHAVERAEAERADVEFITESPTLDALGGIGAILRF